MTPPRDAGLPPETPRLVEARSIGIETTIGAFTHLSPEARVGRDCSIGDQVTIGNEVRLGDRVVVGDGVHLQGEVEIGDDVMIGPNATFASAVGDRPAAMTVVHPAARVGAGATVLAGLTIGRGAVVEAGAVVTHNVPPHAVVGGHPARIQGYAGPSPVAPGATDSLRRGRDTRVSSRVRGVEVIALPVISDLHGKLAVGEIGRGLPFQPKRFFLVYDVPSREVRGEHAHRTLRQLLVCLRGTCSIIVDDGRHREDYHLDSPALGLHIGPMVWASQSDFSPDAALLVLASEQYDAEDYVRDYGEFVAAVKGIL